MSTTPKKVSHCCGAPIVKAPAPFESFICTECVNMTIPVKAGGK